MLQEKVSHLFSIHLLLKTKDDQLISNFTLSNRPSLKNCSACKLIKYCSIDCQSRDWKLHKFDCKLPKARNQSSELFPIELHDLNLIYRLIILASKFPEKFEEPVKTFDGEINFSQVMNKFGNSLDSLHTTYEPDDPIHELASAGAKCFGANNIPMDGLSYIRLQNILISHRCDIMDDNFDSIGSGIFAAVSYYDFSCSPNCCHVFDGIKMQLRAVKEFDTDEQPPLIAYIDPDLSGPSSQFMKQNNLYCQCENCSSQIFATKSRNISTWLSLKREFNEGILTKNCGEALKKGLELLAHDKKIFSNAHPYRTILMKKLVEISIKSKSGRTGVLVKDLENDFLITHGKEHSLYSELEPIFESHK